MEMIKLDSSASCGCGDFKLAPLPALIQECIRGPAPTKTFKECSVVVVHDEGWVVEPYTINQQMRMMWDSVARKMTPTAQMIAEQTAANITQALSDEGLMQIKDTPKP
ncbi:hypothetical protein [Stenotrophomonas sp. PS02301]|uniref:hypothetical protein n=1 Tax=Stenotrophomonas sp. PS02301 TaxID=2991427 RepID=UPI00249B7E4A|nr:hypothetical protein [Stenotrophomonas sp. PS02301]